MNKTSKAANNLLFSIEERSKLPSPVASWMPPMLAVIQKYLNYEQTVMNALNSAKAGNTLPASFFEEALNFDPLK